MTDIDKAIQSLVNLAQGNLDRAYKELGAKPGPGIDIFILPSNPISADWQLDGKTECGKRWLKFMSYPLKVNPTQLARMKREAHEWGLSYHTDWSHVLETKVDYD